MNIGFYSLNALYSFESSARHLSFTLAGKELHVTQGAISQQIKQLESQLGFALFHRQPRRLKLTEKGELLAKTVRHSLRAIQDAIEELQKDKATDILRISVLPSFASKWLMPRLARFNEIYPHIKLEVSSEGRLADLAVENIDLAIRYGRSNYPGLQTTLLKKEEIYPVCSPSFLINKTHPRYLEDLKDHVLIHDASDAHSRYTGFWDNWFEAVGVKGINISRGTTFNQSELVMNAAVMGQGIALGRSVLVNDDITQGRLVRLFDTKVVTELSYYIVNMEKDKNKEKIKIFREWLLKEANTPS